MLAKDLALKYLPAPAIKQVRAVKSYMAVCFFRPYQSRHNYAGYELAVHITDRTGKLWYDHELGRAARTYAVEKDQAQAWSEGV